MRIAVDASRAISREPTGVENYSLQLVRHLVRLCNEQSEKHELILYCREAPEHSLFADAATYRLRVIPFPRLWTHVRLSLAMLQDRPDVLFVPGHVLPIVRPERSVVTIHDLGHLYYPEAYPPRTLRYLSWSTRFNAWAGRHLLADSETTRQDLIERLQVRPEKITVVHPGLNPIFLRPANPRRDRATRRQYGVEGPYILYVGTLQPRKNVERLIEAFALAKKQSGFPERLVLAGRIGWLPEGILRKLDQLGEAVTVAGYVPDEHLPALYAGATLFVLPSLFEGFGMPVVEAMACGAPVLASDAGSLPEVVGDAGVLFDPHSTTDLAEALAWLCEHAEFREQLVEKGRRRARGFGWEEAASRVLDVLERAGRGEI